MWASAARAAVRKFCGHFLAAGNLLDPRVKPTRKRFVDTPQACALALLLSAKKFFCSAWIDTGRGCLSCWKYTPETGAGKPREFVDGTKPALFAKRMIMAEVVAVRASMSSSIALIFFDTFLIWIAS